MDPLAAGHGLHSRAVLTGWIARRRKIPAESIPNIVYVRHIPFYVKVINFGE
jgi:hypothetical protein